MVLLDAVYNLTQHGYPVYTLLVRDEFGNGVPVAFLITDEEKAEPVKEFLVAVQQAR